MEGHRFILFAADVPLRFCLPKTCAQQSENEKGEKARDEKKLPNAERNESRA